MKRLIISNDAAADLEDIGKYIAQDNLEVAISFVKQLKRRCNDLIPFPGVGRKREEIESGFRSIAEGEYVIFFRVPAEDVIEIMRIVHGKRDIGKALGD